MTGEGWPPSQTRTMQNIARWPWLILYTNLRSSSEYLYKMYLLFKPILNIFFILTLVCKCCGWNWNWKLAKLWWIPGFQPRKQRIFRHGWFEQCWILHRATRWGLLRYYSRLCPNNSCFRRQGFFQQSWGKWPCCCYLCRMLEYILNKYIPSWPSYLLQVVVD